MRYLQKSLKQDIPKEKTFVSSIIPKVDKRVKKKLEMYLQNALTVALIVLRINSVVLRSVTHTAKSL